MRLSRRQILLSGLAALPLIGAGSIARHYYSRTIEDSIRRSISQHFGKKIANAQAAEEFAQKFAESFREKNGPKTTQLLARRLLTAVYSDEALEEREKFTETVVLDFVKSTNAIRAFEAGNKLVFLGLDASDYACQNTWGANWL